jgi:predicted RNase H-like HicB family nuclease
VSITSDASDAEGTEEAEVPEFTAEELAAADTSHYSMLIQWSEEDQLYLVTLPDWEGRVLQPVTHGRTHVEAAEMGREVLALLILGARQDGHPLPEPRLFTSDAPDELEGSPGASAATTRSPAAPA